MHHDVPSTGPRVELSRTNVISDYIALILSTEHPRQLGLHPIRKENQETRFHNIPLCAAKPSLDSWQKVLSFSSFLFFFFKLIKSEVEHLCIYVMYPHNHHPRSRYRTFLAAHASPSAPSPHPPHKKSLF